jgi:hypothetical protein
VEGIIGIRPEVKRLTFKTRGKMDVHFVDGRTVIVPLSWFPSINKLTTAQRERWYVMPDGLFSFDDCPEIFHVEQVLGKEEAYRYLKPKLEVA